MEGREYAILDDMMASYGPLRSRRRRSRQEAHSSVKVIDGSPLKVGTVAVVCMADKLGAFHEDNLIMSAWPT